MKLAIDQAPRCAGTQLPLFVTLRRGGVSRYVKALGKRFDKQGKNAEPRPARSRPWITKEQTGRVLKQRPAVRAIVAHLRSHRRSALRIRAVRVEPSVTRARFGPIIVIRRESKVLNLFRGMRLWKRLGVATGQSSYPTPIGRFSIVTMQRHPWYPPDSDWAENEKPSHRGREPVGDAVDGHQRARRRHPRDAGSRFDRLPASHGCVRMRIPEAEWLFGRVRVGTPVFIVRA